MSEKFNALGVPPDYHPHARHFAEVFRGLGMTPAQIDAAIAWGAAYSGDPAELLPQFDSFCAQHGIPRELADFGIAWHGRVCEEGIEAMPQPPAAAPSGQDLARMREIEAEMRKPPADSAYWQSVDMRDEYLALLQRGAGEAPSAPSAPDARRKAEIEQVMRTDRTRYEQSGMDREYLAILEAESGEGSQASIDDTGIGAGTQEASA